MKILCLDDEKYALLLLERCVKKSVGETDEVFCFDNAKDAIEFSKNNVIDVAFLDVNIGLPDGKTGMDVAEKLKKQNNKTNIVFVTGYSEYSVKAWSIHASGFIEKPVSLKAVRTELNNLRNIVPGEKLLKVQCFGLFEVFDKSGDVIKFPRTKCKELFAYLVYRKGVVCSVKDIAATIFDIDETTDEVNYTYKIISDIKKTLKEFCADSVLVQSTQGIAVNKELFDCDYFDFLDKKEGSKELFLGEFMSQYSWAEDVTAYLESLYKQK